MTKMFMRAASLTLAALVAFTAWPRLAPAQDKKEVAAPAAVPETEEEKGEREVRRQCAVKVCSTLHAHKPAAGQVACSVQKTWRKEVITKILSRGKISWPWGNARCGGDLKVDRAILIKAMTEPEFEAQLDMHEVQCQFDGEKDKYDVKMQIRPKVTFKQGKAVSAQLNWGKIEAPTLAKTVLWPATAADNSLGVLQGTVVDDINDFIQNKCMEVKGEWQGK